MKRVTWKWIIVNDTIIKVTIDERVDSRCKCFDKNGQIYIVSKYDIYDTLTKAKAALDEGWPS